MAYQRHKQGTDSDWRIKALLRIRALIKQADPKIIEEVKWRKPSNPAGIPVWFRDGMICTGETYKDHLRLTFAKGALLKDPKHLFNAYRAILIYEKDEINETAFKDLIRAAVIANQKGEKKSKLKHSI